MTKTTTKITHHVGQQVRINQPEWVNGGVGFDHGDIVKIIEVDRKETIFPIRAEAPNGATGLLSLKEIEPVDASPKEPTAPMTKAVLDLLRLKGSTTALEAGGVLKCRQLPARVLDLKRLGHKIVTQMSVDPTGQKYARYHLQAAA
jgi:hypothetical protein